jgi:Xaa-Pro aminopeptidase
MKSDLDRYLDAANLDAILVRGPANYNSAMTYFTGLVHVTQAYLLKVRGEEPVLFHVNMERDEAARSGLQTRSFEEFDVDQAYEEAKGDINLSNAIVLRRIFKEYNVQGRVSLYGKVEIGPAYSTCRLLEEMTDGIELVGESGRDSVLMNTRRTKDESEVERIRNMGKVTTAVVKDVAGFLASHEVKNGILVSRDGDPLTIGEVKRKIDLWLTIRGAHNPNGVIFAIGYDASIPHSTGTDSDPIPIGKPIIFDIFPCEAGGGYFYDFTRTWCLAYAPDDVRTVYQDVLDAYNQSRDAMRADTLARDYQLMTCELFESRGHPTLRSNPNTQSGYVHSLAHGLGLEVHEAPFSHYSEHNQHMIEHGSVFTIEPGLYYPEREIGVRIEDTVWMRPDGELEVLVDYPKDLVLELPGYAA